MLSRRLRSGRSALRPRAGTLATGLFLGGLILSAVLGSASVVAVDPAQAHPTALSN